VVSSSKIFYCLELFLVGAGHPMELVYSQEGKETCHHRLNREKMIVNNTEQIVKWMKGLLELGKDHLVYIKT